jgi:hypothetical protein
VQVAAVPGEGALARALTEFSKLPAPHRAPVVVRGVLRERFTRLVRANPTVLKTPLIPEPVRKLPGRPATPPRTHQEGEWVDLQLEQAQQALFFRGGGCGFCGSPQPMGISAVGRLS